MGDKMVEVAVAVEKWNSVEDATSSDQCVDRAADGNPQRAEATIVLGGCNDHPVVNDGDLIERSKPRQGVPKGTIATTAL